MPRGVPWSKRMSINGGVCRRLGHFNGESGFVSEHRVKQPGVLHFSRFSRSGLPNCQDVSCTAVTLRQLLPTHVERSA